MWIDRLKSSIFSCVCEEIIASLGMFLEFDFYGEKDFSLFLSLRLLDLTVLKFFLLLGRVLMKDDPFLLL